MLKKINYLSILKIYQILYKYLLTCITAALLIGLNSCQFPYEAEIEEVSGMLSIDGSLVKGDSIQTVKVSRSTALSNPEFDPEIGCVVFIEDELGNIFTFSEVANGTYQMAIEEQFLVLDRAYKLIVITPDDKRYESDYETITMAAPVDSVYYEREDVYDAILNSDIQGIQFYLDLKGSESDSKYYRWSLSEIWEIRSRSWVNYYLNMGDTTKIFLDTPYDLYYCWPSSKIPGIYASSTDKLVSNFKKKIPLHFVSNKSDRLQIKYSLLVEQYSLNEGAYSYWNQIKLESEESGGLYTQQPGQVKSNLYNVSDSKENVFGYFWASSKTTKRIIINHPPDLVVYQPKCELEELNGDILENGPYPIYVSLVGIPAISYTSDQKCLDCRRRGGSTNKPSFWK